MAQACEGRPEPNAAPPAPMPVPAPIPAAVPVLRLPRGPQGPGRGFAWARGPVPPPSSVEAAEQRARAALRERFLRGLRAARGRPVRLALPERAAARAELAACDRAGRALLLRGLRTPLGPQRHALLRCSDLIAFAFELP